MSWTSIPLAHTYWRRHLGLPDRPANLEEAEAFILKHPPATAKDAACILDVVCANGGDLRCDGLDLLALRRVHELLSTAD